MKPTTFHMDTLGVKEDPLNIQGNQKQVIAKTTMISQANSNVFKNQQEYQHQNSKNDYTRNASGMN